MKDTLDDWMADLAAAPADRPLHALEAEIGGEIAARRREAGAVRAQASLRLAAVGLALAVGLATGGVVAGAAIGASPPAGPFAAATRLAPSTLLDAAG